MSTKIEWVQNPDGLPGETWNPIVGCSHVSPGCDNCYAEKMAWRLKCMGQVQYKSVVTNKGWTGKTYLAEKQLSKPHRLRKHATTFFVCSMSDLFHEDVPLHWADSVFGVMRDHSQHTFILLTKRAKGMRQYMNNWVKRYKTTLPNVWLGVTAENQLTAKKRVHLLLRTPAAVRFVSVEPMLEPVDLPAKLLIGWVIIGAESGPKRRPCKLEWVRNLVGQCRRAQVPVFVKQLDIDGKLSKNMDEWPEDLKIRQMPTRERKQ